MYSCENKTHASQKSIFRLDRCAAARNRGRHVQSELTPWSRGWPRDLFLSDIFPFDFQIRHMTQNLWYLIFNVFFNRIAQKYFTYSKSFLIIVMHIMFMDLTIIIIIIILSLLRSPPWSDGAHRQKLDTGMAGWPPGNTCCCRKSFIFIIITIVIIIFFAHQDNWNIFGFHEKSNQKVFILLNGDFSSTQNNTKGPGLYFLTNFFQNDFFE